MLKAKFEAVYHNLVFRAESKHGVKCKNPESTCTAAPRTKAGEGLLLRKDAAYLALRTLAVNICIVAAGAAFFLTLQRIVFDYIFAIYVHVVIFVQVHS